MIDLETKVMFGLNETGAFLWRATETTDSCERLSQLVSAGTAEPVDVATIQAFFEELEALGLLHKVSADEAPANTSPLALPESKELGPPQVLWQEALERIAASCAFLPAQNPLCTQVPMA